ncbi:MAG: hypothetical protein ACKVQU_23320 [Burkholderiales bacterium]
MTNVIEERAMEHRVTWSIEPARTAFETHRAEWDEENRSADNSILLDSNFVGPLVAAFAGLEVLLVRYGRDASGLMILMERIGKGAVADVPAVPVTDWPKCCETGRPPTVIEKYPTEGDTWNLPMGGELG